MNTIICTLFEGEYHFGVAALCNSLYSNGFRGSVYIGYRGKLPIWASNCIKDVTIDWQNCSVLKIENDFKLIFLPLTTEIHLTNYKPDFMLKLMSGPAKSASAIFYFDPDIVIKCRWSYFETWINFGVAIVHEVVSNDMPTTHPFRGQWCELASDLKYPKTRNLTSYINAGFIGMKRTELDFLKKWSKILEEAISRYKYDGKSLQTLDRTYPFNFFDQDALNVTAMCSEQPITEMGPEAMDFVNSGWTMSHATGSPKPWKKNFLLSFLNGFPPTKTDKLYWVHTQNPIKTTYLSIVFLKKIVLYTTSFLGRFYSRY